MVAQATVEAPRFEVDPFWPKPLPNKWVIAQMIGLGVDSHDHVWIVHRSDAVNATTKRPTRSRRRRRAAAGSAGDRIRRAGQPRWHWGGPGAPYKWPGSNHGIAVDHKDNVWIGGNDAKDSHILKFTKSGRFLTQYGRRAEHRQQDTENFAGVAKIFVEKANEVYIADGYRNKRVAVLDQNTGAMKRMWGAYGKEPDDTNIGRYDPNAPPAQQFRTPVHCAELSDDGLVYVCDRPNDRIQVFRKDGTFVKEAFIAKRTLGDGSVWDIAFSKDPQQKYLYLADGKNEKIYILDRESLQMLTSFGDGGRQPGQFFAVHSIATDSKGNIFTTETYEGRRVQKFVYKGLAPVTKMDQGTVWPK